MFIMIYATFASEIEASEIIGVLMDEGLIACANTFPVRSFYTWKGNPEESTEVAAIMKSEQKLFSKVAAKIKELHSYDVPAITSYSIKEGSKDYISWLDESLKASRKEDKDVI